MWNITIYLKIYFLTVQKYKNIGYISVIFNDNDKLSIKDLNQSLNNYGIPILN